MTIAQEWDKYRQAVYPDIGPVQEKELRQTFYAGWGTAISLMGQTIMECQDGAEAAMDLGKLCAEYEAFMTPYSKG